jgi:serine/threonine-protein kinase ULK2
MTEIQHPNVVSLVAATKTLSNYYLVMEYCNGGDVEGFLKARGGYLPEVEARLILKQIVKGLQGIKQQNVMHRDLKLANVLVHFPALTKNEIE